MFQTPSEDQTAMNLCNHYSMTHFEYNIVIHIQVWSTQEAQTNVVKEKKAKKQTKKKTFESDNKILTDFTDILWFHWFFLGSFHKSWVLWILLLCYDSAKYKWILANEKLNLFFFTFNIFSFPLYCFVLYSKYFWGEKNISKVWWIKQQCSGAD